MNYYFPKPYLNLPQQADISKTPNKSTNDEEAYVWFKQEHPRVGGYRPAKWRCNEAITRRWLASPRFYPAFSKPSGPSDRSGRRTTFPGDMEDRDSLDAAMQGVYGVFSVQPPEWNPSDVSSDKEIRMGKNVADAAKAAGVRHFVYSSVGGADKQARFRYLAKWEIEKYIKSIGLPATVLRPSGFMESYVNPLFGIQHGTLTEATNPDVPVKLIAVEDIGVFVKLAFRHPDTFLGKTSEIAGDALTPPGIASAIAKATGRSVNYVQLPIETVRQYNETVARLYEWLNEEGYEVDFSALRKLHPNLMKFEDWLEKKGKAMFEKLFQSSP